MEGACTKMSSAKDYGNDQSQVFLESLSGLPCAV